MRHMVLAGAAVLALGGCSWFHSDQSEARNTASPWDSAATRDRQAAELQGNTTPGPSRQAAAGSTANSTNGAGVSRDQVKQVQQTLKSEGLYHGQIDGIAGPQTKQALTSFQQAHGLQATGTLDQQTEALLQGGQTTGTGTSTPSQNHSSTTGASPNGAGSAPQGGQH